MPPNDDLRWAIAAHNNLRDQLLAAFPELSDDEQTLADTLEGQSDLKEQAIAILRYVIEREAHGKAISDLIDAMTIRKRRLEEGARSLRLMVLHAMFEAGEKKFAAADMSVSIGRGKPKIIIVNEADVPAHLCRVTVEPSKTLIAVALEAGDDVPGVTLGNPQPFLTIHRG